MAQTSFPVSKRPFTVSDWRYVIGNEPGIKEDVNGTSYDLAFSTNSDEVFVGSATQDSVTVVGGGGHVIPAAQPQALVVPAPTNAARTDLIVVRYDPAWAVLPTDEAQQAAHVGPCRLHRIAGAEGSGVPSHDPTPPGVEDFPLWEVTRTPGTALSSNGTTRKDRRVRTGPNVIVPTGADRPTGAPLGTRAVMAATGKEYIRALDAQGAPTWYLLGARTGVWDDRTSQGGDVTITFDEPFLPGVVPSVVVQDTYMGEGVGMIFWKVRGESATQFIARSMPASGAAASALTRAKFRYIADV